MIKRAIDLQKVIKPGKVSIIYGPRQVGKTTLVKQYLAQNHLSYKEGSGDDLKLNALLSQCTLDSTKEFVGDFPVIFIDEAQKIENIGLALKLMVDNYPQTIFIVTGSSSLDIAKKTGETLTGRKNIVNLYPISQLELSADNTKFELKNMLEEILIYGSYPEIINAKNTFEKKYAVDQIANSYLLKDILEFEGIKNSRSIFNIVKMLALQIGSEVSVSEIAQAIGMDSKTVFKYLDLLEQSFIVFSLGGFSRNLRKEINKMSKYYFYDTGIRNALISNFNKLNDRNDAGQLWENFLMIERMKKNSYKNVLSNYYFWRTYDKKEIDLIEENSGKLDGFEFKWSDKKIKPPNDWLATYDNASYSVINRDNYLDFIL